ncbi:hypothetical protein E2C01_066851 [Portunus trituberculatus]|uniref:Uncharacterized protein n=1 Tax=Portunus trituberculatus TaxID=210409 RepID=A0A5B7HJA5_PORTR|nr:hypothetical protein [Portunus trituberculatus]
MLRNVSEYSHIPENRTRRTSQADIMQVLFELTQRDLPVYCCPGGTTRVRSLAWVVRSQALGPP